MPKKYRLEILLVVVIALLMSVYVRARYIPSFSERHVAVAEDKYDYDIGEPGPWFSAWSLGDGQAFVMIALDPTGRKLDQEIDEAGYRFSRAGYGWAVAFVSLGQADLIPYGLALVGLLSFLALIVIAVRLRPILGSSAWILLANPAVYIGLGGDTSEPLGILLLTIAMASSGWLAAVLLGITRPSFLIAVWGRWSQFLPGSAAALILGVYSLLVFGFDALIPAGGRLGIPLAAYFEHGSLWGWLLAGFAMATVALGLRLRDWAWVLAGAFVVCFGADVLRDPANAWRAAGFLPVLWAFGLHYEPNAAPLRDREVVGFSG